MLKRHENALLARLDELVGRGWTFIAWWELYQWYNAERLAKNTWRDIVARIQELGSDDAFMREFPDGILLSTSSDFKRVSSKL